jgi:AraC-like DNA-binding protein
MTSVTSKATGGHSSHSRTRCAESSELSVRPVPERFTLEDWHALARNSGFSVSRLAALPEVSLGVRSVERLFRRNFNAAPSYWLKRWWVDEARAFIRITGASNKEVAHRFGFWDEAHLCHLFKHVLKRSPQSFAPRRRSVPSVTISAARPIRSNAPKAGLPMGE